MPEKCLHCGSENLENGSLMSRSAITWISEENQGSIFRKDQSVQGWHCLDCGYIMLFV